MSKFISKRTNFVDITKTRNLEALAAAKQHTFPSAPSHQKEMEPLISKLQKANLRLWVTTLAR
jgi:hypothetical protein